jgi:hypothetical protein
VKQDIEARIQASEADDEEDAQNGLERGSDSEES